MKTDDLSLWERVSLRLTTWSNQQSLFRYGQQDSLQWISKHIPENGIILADEVGLGKTRLAILTMIAVLEEGGSVVAVVPPGLLYQWSQEAREVMLDLEAIFSVKKWKPITLRTYNDVFTALGERNRYPLANNKEQRWVLISQTFDLYRVRTTARSWRIELPALVKAQWAEQDQAHGKDRWIQYRRQRGIEDVSYQENEFLYMENRAAEYLSKMNFAKEYAEIWEDERIRPNIDGKDVVNEKCALYFQNGQPGRKLLMHLVGKLVGSIDLLVMDEAHKSREDGDNPQKRLGRLLGEILITSQRCRRFSMTATPIELDPEQWFSLLKRTGIDEQHPKWSTLASAIDLFSLHLKNANSRPDQLEALEQLIEASHQFQNTLAPFVTRRRRMHQEEMQKLLPLVVQGSHPHRDLKFHPIQIHGLSDDWRKMVLALEGQGLSSKGLASLGLAQRQADIRYSSGLQCEYEMDESELPPTNKYCRKDLRVRAWAKLQREISEKLSGPDSSWLWNHPRIVYAANRIEELCEFDGLNPQEKVLVFGRFTEPMKALQDTLNMRQTLRIIDSGKVALVPYSELKELHLMYEYQQQHQRGLFTGNLKGVLLTKDDLLIHVQEARERYRKTQEALRERFHGEMQEWVNGQPGDAALLRLKEKNQDAYRKIFDLLRADVFDDILYRTRELNSITESELYQLAHLAWVSHLNCILHGSDEDVTDAEAISNERKRTEYKGDDKQLAELDSRADLIDPEQFIDYLKHEPRSSFCRMLDGSVKQATRRSVQSSFNRHETGPYVLIAQSTVGREGLNLHKACRRIFLFHPEWNPGVMEQQIGRVDRIESLWNQMATEWKKNPITPYPKIEIESLVFQGTYDEYQAHILKRRRATLNAQLFGALLDEDAMAKVPSEYHEKLAEAAPDWGPGKKRVKTSCGYTRA